jgi:hypothetical protein
LKRALALGCACRALGCTTPRWKIVHDVNELDREVHVQEIAWRAMGAEKERC